MDACSLPPESNSSSEVRIAMDAIIGFRQFLPHWNQCQVAILVIQTLLRRQLCISDSLSGCWGSFRRFQCQVAFVPRICSFVARFMSNSNGNVLKPMGYYSLRIDWTVSKRWVAARDRYCLRSPYTSRTEIRIGDSLKDRWDGFKIFGWANAKRLQSFRKTLARAGRKIIFGAYSPTLIWNCKRGTKSTHAWLQLVLVCTQVYCHEWRHSTRSAVCFLIEQPCWNQPRSKAKHLTTTMLDLLLYHWDVVVTSPCCMIVETLNSSLAQPYNKILKGLKAV